MTAKGDDDSLTEASWASAQVVVGTCTAADSTMTTTSQVACHAGRGRRERFCSLLVEKKQLVNLRVLLIPLRLFRQLFHKLGMKIKRVLSEILIFEVFVENTIIYYVYL